jgi:hypothetical protein
MRPGNSIQQKQYKLDELLKQAARWRLLSRTLLYQRLFRHLARRSYSFANGSGPIRRCAGP